MTRHRLSEILAAILVATLFLLAHPYGGIRHDAILYTAQALHAFHPQNFKHDLFFQFGSQDDWTLYGRLYGILIAHLGIRASNMLGLIAAQALWWSGMWRLSKRLLPLPWNWICLLLAASMPADYGDGFVFSYDESFLSARLPAEALSLWSIAFVLERRNMAAIVTALIAIAIHPLIGAVGLAAVVLVMMPRFAAWRVFAVTFLIFAIVQFWAPPSFAIHPFDPQWLQVVRNDVSFLFPSRWYLSTWSESCWVIALPMILMVTETKERGLVWKYLALIGIAGISVSTLADIAGRDAIWIQLQLWRVLWLLMLMQWAAVATLIHRERHTRPALIWLLAICWLTLDVGGGFAALAVAALVHIERIIKAPATSAVFFREVTPLYRAFLIAGTLAAAALWLLYQVAYHYVHTAYWPGTPPVNFPWLEAIVHTRLMAALVALLALYLFRGKRVAPVFYLFLITLISYALINIDQRSDTMKALEARLDAPQLAPFAGHVAPGQMVYWDGPSDELVFPWLLMKTSSYFSPLQASGIVFHRETTFDALRRLSIIKQDKRAGWPKAEHANMNELFPDPKAFKPLSRDGIVRVCHVPDLDFVVSRLHDSALSTNDEWAPTKKLSYWLYDCKRIRAMGGPSDSSSTEKNDNRVSVVITPGGK